MFISAPEQALAEKKLGVRHPAARLVGFGLDQFSADPERFRQKYSIHEPFMLYAGRLAPAKNVPQLISYFLAYRQRHPEQPIKLVLAGSGPLSLPDHPDLRPLGFLPQQDLYDAYAAATVFCQPSLLESFSIVLMEAWLAGRPVLVHGHCAVTCHHVLQSNGGLYYTSPAEFCSALGYILDHPQHGQRMGAQGQAYVHREFNWPATLGRFREALARSWAGHFTEKAP